eukprot:TRINITY_DN1781_c0_g1_i2.p1 TRINITY_DN1781_c0_g1~~TRINITY_DN1781_c0_g1_i2.p1  ORF type:complete len:100 (-),score=2.83 TRINITY_DN1781_c0_g1_i2:128-385(-)
MPYLPQYCTKSDHSNTKMTALSSSIQPHHCHPATATRYPATATETATATIKNIFFSSFSIFFSHFFRLCHISLNIAPNLTIQTPK